MAEPTFDELSPALAKALEGRGFTALTAIQEAVLEPAHDGRDLRLLSKTGSGKTVAVGLVLAPEIERIMSERAAPASAPATGSAPGSAPAPASAPAPGSAPASEPAPAPAAAPARASASAATPAAILIAPTRELAAQLARELTWLYEPLGASVSAVTGGTSYPLELRALRKGPLVVVGTPGRLLDHLERGSIDTSQVVAVVLDEADQMLDMGFREELEAILEKMPRERRTHLVAATFSREVRALADRYQHDAVTVEGSSLGEANLDITHVAHLVKPDQRFAAIINLLLLAPSERALVFSRTREGTAELAERLTEAGFKALALSGELEQRERTRTLDAFRSGAVTVLVATDVAARGLDIPDVSRVIHADPPGDVETFIHRSGRTGRAGRKGTSVVLVPAAARDYVTRLFRNARVQASWTPAPGPEEVLREADARMRAELAAAAAEQQDEEKQDARLRALAEGLLEDLDPVALVTALLGRVGHSGPTAPLPVTPMMPPAVRPERGPQERTPRDWAKRVWSEAPESGPRERGGQEERAAGARRPHSREGAVTPGTFVRFRVTWGGRHGADARRVLALVCRRGGIESNQIGAIDIGDFASTIEVATPLPPDFIERVGQPDARDPRVRIEPLAGVAPPPSKAPPRKAWRPTGAAGATKGAGAGAGMAPPRRPKVVKTHPRPSKRT